MTTPNAPTTRRVKLKRVPSLAVGDKIVPGLGLFTRAGTRMASQRLMTDAWERIIWHVCANPWMNDVPEMNVLIGRVPNDSSDILHTPLDAYVVLA